MKKFIIIFLLLNFLTACQSAKEGFTLKKKDTTDEFLVEKKNPLIMPPDYDTLPRPGNINLGEENKNLSEFKDLFGNSKKNTKKNTVKKSSIDELVIEKIK